MKKAFLIFTSILILFSCNDERLNTVPQSTGTPGHILLILSSAKWKGNTGDEIRKVIKQNFPGLPQDEPLFNLSCVPDESFSKLLHRTRNVLQTRISVNVKKPKINVRYDLWSKPQVVVTVEAKNDKELVKVFQENSKEIISIFEKAEEDRLKETYSKLQETKVINKIKEKQHISLIIPKGYKLDVDTTGFMWISRETPRLAQAFVIWSYTYRDTSDLNPENLLLKQDSVTRMYVPGPEVGSYMISEQRAPITSKTFDLNNQYAVEMRGLWHVNSKTVFMGGPFVSYTVIDKKRNRVVTVYGYVFAGNQDKRNYVRQVEAVLKTLKIL